MIEKLNQYENSQYEFSVDSRRESIETNKAQLDAIRQDASSWTLSEALTSDAIKGFIPDLFLDDIITLGQRTAIARNLFPVVGQSTHSTFKQRYRWKDEGVQVSQAELVEVNATQSERDVREYGFLKLMDANLFSVELIEDSTLDEATAELQMSANKFFRRENQLMAARLTAGSTGADETKWGNWIQGIDSSSEADLLDAMTDAYLDMTTRLTDMFPTESLTWIVSPTIWSLLFKDTKTRRFDNLGVPDSVVTGRIAGSDQIFRIPIVIMETGYFRDDNEWVPQPYDFFLVAAQFAAGIRERSSMRTTPIDLTRMLGSGLILWERLMPWIRNHFAYRRISPIQNYPDIIPKLENVNIIAGVDDAKVFGK